MATRKVKQTTTACPVCGRSLGLIQRNAAIVKEREQGATLEAVAHRYGLTRARIYAICEQAEKWKGLAKEER